MGVLPSFFGRQNHKRFNFKPRYYDAQREELNQRIARIKSEMAEENNQAASSQDELRSKMRANWRKNKSVSQQNTNRNFRVTIIAIILATVLYFYLYH